MTSEHRYRYQISTALLVTGLIGLVLIVGLLLLLAPSVGTTTAWWVFTSIFGGLLAVLVGIMLLTWRHRPMQIVLKPEGVDLPVGALGTSRLFIPWGEVTGIRMIGRATAFRRERNWEVTYIIHSDSAGGEGADEQYLPMICELFDDMETYEECRDLIRREVKDANPDVWIDKDGVRLNGPSDESHDLDENQDMDEEDGDQTSPRASAEESSEGEDSDG